MTCSLCTVVHEKIVFYSIVLVMPFPGAGSGIYRNFLSRVYSSAFFFCIAGYAIVGTFTREFDFEKGDRRVLFLLKQAEQKPRPNGRVTKTEMFPLLFLAIFLCSIKILKF